jgi:uncharacterized Zn finger protein
MQTKIKCPNCGNMCRINEYVKHCPKCGRIFIEFIDIMDEEEIKHRASTHRSGDGVDRLDG